MSRWGTWQQGGRHAYRHHGTRGVDELASDTYRGGKEIDTDGQTHRQTEAETETERV